MPEGDVVRAGRFRRINGLPAPFCQAYCLASRVAHDPPAEDRPGCCHASFGTKEQRTKEATMGLDMMAMTTAEPISAPVDFEPVDPTKLHTWRKHPNLNGRMHQLYRAKGGQSQSEVPPVSTGHRL